MPTKFMSAKISNFLVLAMYRLEVIKRNLRNSEPEVSVASGGFLIAKISLCSL